MGWSTRSFRKTGIFAKELKARTTGRSVINKLKPADKNTNWMDTGMGLNDVKKLEKDIYDELVAQGEAAAETIERGAARLKAESDKLYRAYKAEKEALSRYQAKLAQPDIDFEKIQARKKRLEAMEKQLKNFLAKQRQLKKGPSAIARRQKFERRKREDRERALRRMRGLNNP